MCELRLAGGLADILRLITQVLSDGVNLDGLRLAQDRANLIPSRIALDIIEEDLVGSTVHKCYAK